MDGFIEFVIEVFGGLLEDSIRGIKNPNKRKWALTALYSVVMLGFITFLVCMAVSFGRENDRIGAMITGGIAAITFFVSSYIIIRGHRKKWKKKEK